MATPPRPPNLSSVITGLIKRGLSTEQGLATARDAGVTVSRNIWDRAWGQVVESIGKRPDVSLAPLSRRPTPNERTVWDTRKQRGYLYQIEAQVQIEGTDEVFTTYTSVRSARLLRYGDALDAGIGQLTGDMEQYGEQVLGGTITGVYEMQPSQLPSDPREAQAIEQFGPGAFLTEIPAFGGGTIVRGEGGRFVGVLE